MRTVGFNSYNSPERLCTKLFLSITKSAVRSLSERGDCFLLKPYRIFTNFPVDFY